MAVGFISKNWSVSAENSLLTLIHLCRSIEQQPGQGRQQSVSCCENVDAVADLMSS